MPYPTLESRPDTLKMLDEITEARQAMLARCARLTAAQLNDPVYAGTWPVLKILAHLAWAEAWMLAWIKARPGVLAKEAHPPEVAPNLAAIRAAFDEAHAATIAFVKSRSESILKETCTYGRRGEQTVGGVLFHLITHEFHHRAFIGHKLEKLGARA